MMKILPQFDCAHRLTTVIAAAESLRRRLRGLSRVPAIAALHVRAFACSVLSPARAHRPTVTATGSARGHKRSAQIGWLARDG
jgi:hypothetical protein